jgi:ferredoxin-NADP reductase
MTSDANAHLAHHVAELALWDSEADDVLICTAVIPETHDVRTFVFEPASPRRFAYRPGQFLTFEFPVGEERMNRCYTISSSPMRPHAVSITVKRVPNGPVSNWLHDHCSPGTAVTAVGPMGEFSCLNAPAPKYLFLSGGSGITPLMSMSRAFADLGRRVDIVFVHAARTPADIVFRDELDLIARRVPGFRVAYIAEGAGSERGWPGPLGRISAQYLELVAPDLRERSVWCCGPAPFMSAARSILAAFGHDPRLYQEESFDFATLAVEQPSLGAEAVEAAAVAASVPVYSVTFTKLGRTVEVRGDQFILAAARAQGARLPSSCTKGLCGACKSKLVSGTVDMNHNGGIRKKEIEQGLFLPCCSKPTSDLAIER